MLSFANWKIVLFSFIIIHIMSLFILLFAQKYSHNLGKDLGSTIYLGKSLKEGLSLFVESKILNIINYFPIVTLNFI